MVIEYSLGSQPLTKLKKMNTQLEKIKYVFMPEEPLKIKEQKLDYSKDIEWTRNVTITFNIA